MTQSPLHKIPKPHLSNKWKKEAVTITTLAREFYGQPEFSISDRWGRIYDIELLQGTQSIPCMLWHDGSESISLVTAISRTGLELEIMRQSAWTICHYDKSQVASVSQLKSQLLAWMTSSFASVLPLQRKILEIKAKEGLSWSEIYFKGNFGTQRHPDSSYVQRKLGLIGEYQKYTRIESEPTLVKHITTLFRICEGMGIPPHEVGL